ncbi:MAG TPA: ABC transporter permease [Pyrinomonadaceae bacterium]|nr:ABC transporter permease [Pyrinomonadaceae bacterium]
MQTVTTARHAARLSWGDRFAGYGAVYGAGAALLLLVVVNMIFTPNFASVRTPTLILLQVAPTVLVAIGMTLVIATGGIDLSVGSVMAIAGAVAATSLDRGAGVAIVAGLSVGLLAGLFNGWLIAAFKIQPIIVTLALFISGRGVAQVISNGELIPFSNASFSHLGRGVVAGVPVQVVIMVAVAALGIFILRATSFGRYVLATGGNEAAARLAGVSVGRTKITVYAISGLLAGLAGLIETGRAGASDAAKVGLQIELDAIAAVVVGGTLLTGGRATVVGAIIGALIMAIITTSINMNDFPFAWSLVLKAAIIVVAVYVQRPKVA